MKAAALLFASKAKIKVNFFIEWRVLEETCEVQKKFEKQ